ncbi:hypothetical protein HPB48_011726 [Haemaphysalis longicornis]|uniref:Uncharacterized protein n=1 Tax=Haemaphysalis longicornis TaxID=44386 RepID=A0A9J6FQI6_HAELO|nr:hypothetical protein HPB48_011726 [Haemaphysalis longicornis]
MSVEKAIQRYRTLLHHIKAERPDIGTIFVSLVLPRRPNERLRQPNLRRVGIINQEAHTFNCRLVDLCNEMPGVFYFDHAMQHFSPRWCWRRIGCTRTSREYHYSPGTCTTCWCEPGNPKSEIGETTPSPVPPANHRRRARTSPA